MNLLYVARFVIEERGENYVRAEDTSEQRLEVISTKRFLVTHLFLAADNEQAYAKAMEMCSGLSDSHCDEGYDRTSYQALGLFELNLLGDINAFNRSFHDVYGSALEDVIYEGQSFETKSKAALALFQSSGQSSQ